MYLKYLSKLTMFVYYILRKYEELRTKKYEELRTKN